MIEFTNTSFVSGNTYVLKYNNVAIGTFTANTGDNVKNLVKAINSNSMVSDIRSASGRTRAKFWWSNNASNTYYVQLNFSQNGNWKNAGFSMTLNGGATTSIYSVKRAMGYGTASKGQMVYGTKSYELSNHLGNVLEVITDRKFGVDDGVYNQTTGAKTSATLDGQVSRPYSGFYIAQIQSYADYDPFGTVQDGRKGGSGYRWSFNGKES